MEFGESWSAVVAAGTNAAIVTHNIPSEVLPGETRTIRIEVQNNGAVLWDNADYQLRSPTVGGISWVPQRIFNQQVASNDTIAFNLSFVAPSVEGAYTFNARMYVGRRIGGGFFGETLSVPVQVSSAVVPEFAASLVSHTVPATMNTGERALVSFTMQNDGWHTWEPLFVDLRSKSTMRSTRSRPLVPVAQNETVSFPTWVTAPGAVGSYTYQVRLAYYDGVRYNDFGQLVEVPVTVGSVDTAITLADIADNDATFEFVSVPGGGTFECSLDGAAYASCSSPHVFTDLAEGLHTFEVRATVNSLTDSIPASHTWTIAPAGPVCLGGCPFSGEGVLNGSFETGDYQCWTIADAPGQPQWGTWGIAENGEVVQSGAANAVVDYSDCAMVAQGSPGLPYTFVTTDGNYMSYMTVGGPLFHRLYQDVVIPACATHLQWDMQYRNFNPGGFNNTNQYLAIQIRNATDNSLTSSLFRTMQGVQPANQPLAAFSADVSAYAGQTVRLNIEANTQTFYFDIRFDNLRFTGCP